MTSPEQLKLLSEEVEREGTLELFAEFKQWCARLKGLGLSIPLLKETDQGAVAFVRVFHEVAVGYEEREGSELRRVWTFVGFNNNLIDMLVSDILLWRVILECGARRLHLPREILLLWAAMEEQLPVRHPPVEEPCA